MNTEQLLMYYEVLLKGMEWKILQKEKKENKTILLAESQVKKIVTLIIYPDNEFSLVKIFLRRNYNF